MTKPKIAVLGLGIMGRGIALNFLKNGYEVSVWNRSIEKTVEFTALSASVAATPAIAAENADIIFDVTANDESSKYVFCDESEGVLSYAKDSAVLITCATLTVGWTLELAALCEKQGLVFFDMPMTGSRAGSESGNLQLLVGGDKEKFLEIEEHLEAISCDRPYFGAAGNGMKFKLILNAIQAAHVVAFGDAMRQAKAAGVDMDAAGSFLNEKPGGYPTQMSWKLFQDPPSKVNFSVKWILKDLIYAREMLEESGFSNSVSPAILDVSISVLQRAADSGLGDEDWTVVNQL